MTNDRKLGARRGIGGGRALAIALVCASALLPLACGDDGDDDQQTLDNALRDFGDHSVVRLDTAALASAVEAGEPIRLPFRNQESEGGAVVEREVQLTLRNLRSPDLTHFVVKDGDAGTGSSLPLPPPATYQGRVRDGGAAVFTVTDEIVEGSMLVAPEGWSFIEPLEPQLRQRNVEPGARERLLRKYNHIVYNARDALGSPPSSDILGDSTGPIGSPLPPSPLVLSMVADGDAELLRAYPLDSVMPFWLEQETLLNAVDWLYNCLEPEANDDNAYADCANDFDGGANAFQARVRIDRLEVWSTGGPDAPTREGLMPQTISMTHQASPPCCGPPHTAGESSLVHFFSGKDLRGGQGLAAGIGFLDYYGPLCFAENPECHHAISQIVPGREFRGTAFHAQSLVAHEIGHNAGAEEIIHFEEVCWLFGEECGTSLMASGTSFTGQSLFLYTPADARMRIGPLLAERLGGAGEP